ncbi:hypothetical protein QMK61_00035 [Fulvimonas sp. R45]|uniref:hypothetical protein n=1 Tax=Fulvimonas sp. R45 TaxID=3045937 RepID=UPI00265FE3B4|nr:hypothetical protein [Fulvimonas sp. R45]MDO1527208.1 hypothetical protein [Fulvimonas sp. R45]
MAGRPPLRNLARLAWLPPLALVVAGFLLAGDGLRAALGAYLAAWLLGLAVALGSMSLVFVHVLTGGAWGRRLGSELAAGARLLPWVALAVLPLLAGMHWLFPWLGGAAGDPELARQHWYLNLPAFLLRTLLCLALWGWLAAGVARRRPWRQGQAAAGLIVLAVTSFVAAVDWIMSLVPRWHSTDIGLLLFSAQALLAFALALCASRAGPRGDADAVARDCGNLLLALVLGWAYVAFMDYLTAWVADLPAETAWYLPRLRGGWGGVALALVGVGLVLPFAALLYGRVKSSRRALAWVAGVVVLAQGLNALWLVLPGMAPDGVTAAAGAALVFLGMLALGALAWRAALRRERSRWAALESLA